MNSVLNAFRHQRKGYSQLPPRRQPLCNVLNAFRHQRKGYCRVRSCHHLSLEVLNAFRHQRKGYAHPFLPMNSDPMMCSTPFGIKGKDTRSVGVMGVVRRISAQRLSASKERIQQLGGRHGEAEIWCSTPFGIKGKDTNGSPAAARPTRCAQRLSASKERIPGLTTLYAGGNSGCSTPFGIKGKDTMASPPPTGLLDVLNAFRHQRKGYPPVPRALPAPFSVLNAFRHQRKGYRRVAMMKAIR